MLRLYRLLMFLYPRHFRRRFGEEMREFLVSRSKRPARGAQTGLPFWHTVLGDFLRTLPAAHLEAWRTRQGRRTRSRRQHRSVQRRFLPALLGDTLYGMRSLRRSPWFTGLAVVTLGVGMMAATTVFSIANGVLLRPPPYEHPESLVLVWGSSQEFGQARDVISGPNFIDFRERNTTLQLMAAFRSWGGTLFVDEVPVSIDGLRATPEFFRVLRTDAFLGRTFNASDGELGARVAIISQGLWHRLFDGDRAVIGRKVETLDGPYVVIGVLPPDFQFAINTDWVTPLAYDDLRSTDRTSINYWTIGRLRAGLAPPDVQTDLNRILRDLEAQDPRMRRWVVVVDRLQDALSEFVRPPVMLMLGSVALVLLIACANVANLILARGITRQREVAIRLSLGASRTQIVRLVLVESLMLAIGAGALGLTLTATLVQLLPGILPPAVPVPGSAALVQLPTIGIDGAVMLFTVAVVLLTAVLFGLAPTVQLLNTSPHQTLQSTAGRVGASRRGQRAQRLLVASELAAAVTLLTITGLTLVSTARLVRVHPGLNPDRVLTMYFGELNSKGTAERASYYREVLRSVGALSAVEAVAINDYVPFQQEDDFEGFHHGAGAPEGGAHRTEWRRVSSDYFQTVGIPLVRGRGFTASDDDRAPSVVVINQAMVARYWGDADPVGKQIVIHEGVFGVTEVVGIVGNVRRRGLDQPPPPVMYVPFHRRPRPVVGLFVRTNGEPGSHIEDIRDAIWSVDSQQPIYGIDTLPNVLDRSIALSRLVLYMVASIGMLALTLAMVGVFSVMSYAVTQQRRDICVQMALGADRKAIHQQVVTSAMKLALAATVVGAVGALGASRLAAALLFEVSATEILPYAAAVVAVATVAAVAAYLPARRASNLDPINALRTD